MVIGDDHFPQHKYKTNFHQKSDQNSKIQIKKNPKELRAWNYRVHIPDFIFLTTTIHTAAQEAFVGGKPL